MSPGKQNIAASVRARLLNVAKAQGVDFQQVLVRFALERILYRLTLSKYADRFFLKGALLFTLWYDMPHQATCDVDLLAQSIKATFDRRGMSVPIDALPAGLTDEFAHDPSRQALWQAFLKKNELAPEPLPAVVGRLRAGLEPALNRMASCCK